MKIFSTFLSLIPMALGLSPIAVSAEVFPAYRPQPRGIPKIRVSGGSRSPFGTSCISDPQAPPLMSIFPENDLGYTTHRYPAFQWYMPRNNASHVEFNLYEVVDENAGTYQPVYQTAFVPSSSAGIATLQLMSAAGLAPLNSGTYYYWSVDVYCLDETTPVMTTDGFVEVVTPDPELATALTESNGVERAAIAAENSLWFDATRALTEHLQIQPNDRQALESWSILLKSIGLEDLTTAPLLS
ncbi:MAG: DUF928 domain-containing protein [Symploca sp. SIO2G7]|nr:DUF928 domain-containing protein [Symploca sp. SIO2G7]